MHIDTWVNTFDGILDLLSWRCLSGYWREGRGNQQIFFKFATYMEYLDIYILFILYIF